MLKRKIPREKNVDLIPKGLYCHGSGDDFPSVYICPYWDFNEAHPHQENGYCHFIGKGDWEIAVFEFSLIWDKCKEYGIKIDDRKK